MDSSYVPIYKQAAALQHQFHDMSHASAHHPTAVVLRNEIHHLTNDIAANKNPRTIEHRLHTIQNQLRLAQTLHPDMLQPTHGQPLLNNHQSMALSKHFEMMRKNIRMNPHY